VASSSSTAEIASFKNELEVVGPSGTAKVGKKKMVTFDVSDNDNDGATLAKNVEQDPYDQWDKQAVEYHDQYSKDNSTPYGYGYSDLSYYGGYSNVAGYGTMWQPYFAGVGWNPFMDGAWSWYPGMGFMWASAYPWGWMPYYYGNWVYAPGFGWGWQPGELGTWHGGLHYLGTVAGLRVPAEPKGIVTAVAVGGAVTTNALATDFVVNRGSAGLGIARGSVSNLHHLNTQVEKTGFAELHAAPQFAASSPRSGGYGFGGERGGMSAGGTGHAGTAASGHGSSGGSSGHH
jgi:hypothetical protein